MIPWSGFSLDRKSDTVNKNKNIDNNSKIDIVYDKMMNKIDKTTNSSLFYLVIIAILALLIDIDGSETRAISLIIIVELLAMLITKLICVFLSDKVFDAGYIAIAVHLGVGLMSVATYLGKI